MLARIAFLTLAITLVTLPQVRELPQTGQGVIEGEVRKLHGGDMVGDAEVILTDSADSQSEGLQRQLKTRSGPDGKFSFKGIPAGSYIVGVQSDGSFLRPQVSGTKVVVGNGATTHHVTLSLVAGGTISGRILDSSGRPAASATVTAARIIYQRGRPVLTPAKSTLTNDRGEYRLYWLEPDEYIVSAEKKAATGLVSAYFPGVDWASTAIPVVVKESGESGKTDFGLKSPLMTFKVSGFVIDSVPDTPVAETSPTTAVSSIPQFYLVPLDAARRYETPAVLTNAAAGRSDRLVGKFELRDVLPGRYELYVVALAKGAPAGFHVAHSTIDVGLQNLDEVVLTIMPGSDVIGRVTSVVSPKTACRVQLRPLVLLPNWPPANAFTSVCTSDGTFMIPNVPALQYSVSVFPRESTTYIADILQGATSVDAGIITVTPGTSDNLEIVIKSPASAIRGSVVASLEQLASGVSVALVPEESQRGNWSLYRRVNVGSDGSFVLEGITPGKYRLFAWTGIPVGAEQNSEFMQTYRDDGVEVIAQPGETSLKPISLISK